MTHDQIDEMHSRAEAERRMARLHAERLDPQIPFTDISGYEKGNTGIPYAFTLDSGRPGPHVMIAGLNHGNEPGGREAVTTLLNKVRPAAGKLSLALLNIDAYHASNGVDPYGTRCVDTDLNRVWVDDLLDSDADNSELRRARQLRPLVRSADVLFDIHSTPYEETPFCLLKPIARRNDLVRALGEPKTLVSFESEVANSGTITTYGRFADRAETAVGLSIETGLFFSQRSADCATTLSIRILRHFGVVPMDAHQDLVRWTDPSPKRRIEALFPQMVETDDIALLFRPGSFQPYPEGEIVAYDAKKPIRAPFEGAVPMWIKQKFQGGIRAFVWARLGNDDE